MNVFVEEELRERGFALLCELIRCHPVYGSAGLGAAQEALSRFMTEQGFDRVVRDRFRAGELARLGEYVDVAAFGPAYAGDGCIDKVNVMGVIDSGRPGPTLLLAGHVDVDIVLGPELWAEPELWRAAAVREGRLLGRGAVDMLGGLVGQLLVATALGRRREAWRGRVVFCSVVDEEVGGNGTLRCLQWLRAEGLLASGEKVECLIGEPTGLRGCARSLGFLHFRLLVQGVSCHMGAVAPEENAIRRLSQLVLGFEEQVLAEALALLPGQAPPAGDFVCNFGIINGGRDAAVPPGTVQAEGTLFYPAPLSQAELGAALRRAFAERFSSVASLEIGGFGFGGANCRPELAEYLPGPKDGLFRSPCDARLFASEHIPVLLFGPGQLRQAHSIDEALDVSEWHEYLALLATGAGRFLT